MKISSRATSKDDPPYDPYPKRVLGEWSDASIHATGTANARFRGLEIWSSTLQPRSGVAGLTSGSPRRGTTTTCHMSCRRGKPRKVPDRMETSHIGTAVILHAFSIVAQSFYCSGSALDVPTTRPSGSATISLQRPSMPCYGRLSVCTNSSAVVIFREPTMSRNPTDPQ